MSNKTIFVSDEGEIKGVKKCFALHDFDERRILSRKFFSDLDLPPNMTDEEILKSFDKSTVDATESTIKKLSMILQRVKEYHMRIKTHSEKLEDLLKKFAVEYADVGDKDSRIRFSHTKSILTYYKEFFQNIVHLGGIVREEMDGMKNIIDAILKRTFSERLKRARIDKGYTQQQLAEKLGIARITLTQYERTVNEPNFSMLVRIAKILNVSLDWLSGLSEKNLA